VVDRYVSPPLELPASDQAFSRADLIFYGLDHSNSSFEGRVFVHAPDATHQTTTSDEHYAGSFYILGHGGCFGDVGHCDVPQRTDPFDLRPPHQLQPGIRVLTVTDAVRRLADAGVTETPVTVIAHAAADRPNDVLAFETVRLITYA
jgi:hypothetical protein